MTDVEKTIESLSLEEKAALLQGRITPELRSKGIHPFVLSDGPQGPGRQESAGDPPGLNASVPATCFPSATAMAGTWDPALCEELGAATGEEAAANGVHVLLGPGLNIRRSPLCGRNFESFSEDPYLAGKMAAAYVRGIQSKGVAACPRHFAANSREQERVSVDAVIDERTLREIYLTGFEIAVREGAPKAIMTADNRVNGVYVNENAHLLQTILREEWGFRGFVVTEWGADNDRVEGVKAGSDLMMPDSGEDYALELISAVRDGRLEEEVLDRRLYELLPVVDSTAAAVSAAPKSFDTRAHHALTRRCAEEAVVLLDNDGVLPLDPGFRTAVIGDFAGTPRDQGADPDLINPTGSDKLKDALNRRGLNISGYAKGCSGLDPEPDDQLIESAVELAKRSDAVLLCVGLDGITEPEGMDRESLSLPNGQQTLIEAVCSANANVVLVLSGGAPFLMPERDRYRAAIHGDLSCEAGTGAMADALLGVLCPGGKLTESWPLRLESVPSAPYCPSRQRTAEYREGLYVGYRYYDTAGVPVRYPFGHGLSYTHFAYSDLKADEKTVSFTVKNVGLVSGAEIAQVYVSCRDGGVFRPKKELKGFARISLEPGEAKRVEIALDELAFRYYNIKTDAWEIESAVYEILVGASATDIRLSQELQIVREPAPLPYKSLPSYESGRIASVPDQEFEALLGRPVPIGGRGGEPTENDAPAETADARSGLARFVCWIQNRRKAKT